MLKKTKRYEPVPAETPTLDQRYETVLYLLTRRLSHTHIYKHTADQRYETVLYLLRRRRYISRLRWPCGVEKACQKKSVYVTKDQEKRPTKNRNAFVVCVTAAATLRLNNGKSKKTGRPTKETYKRALQKRPTKETYKKDRHM